MAHSRAGGSEPRARRDWVINSVREAGSLSELAEFIGADSEHEAYFEAKEAWREHHSGSFPSPPASTSTSRPYSPGGRENDVLPGERITVDGHDFHVHGVTHAGTEEERAFLRDHVSDFLGRGATVYCEQGIRSLCFDDYPRVCEMDDYRWSLETAEGLARGAPPSEFEGLAEGVDRLRSRLGGSVFALLESGSGVYGDGFADTVGGVVSSLLTSHVDASRGDDFESFRLTRRVSRNPEMLGELQAYYRRNLLPQPLERDWLRKHDPEVEIFTHARNERMADYAAYHNEEDEEVHLIVGAAHQPGVVYYLEQHRDGERTVDGFELFG